MIVFPLYAMMELFVFALKHKQMLFAWDAFKVRLWKCLCVHPHLHAELKNLILLQIRTRKPQTRFLKCGQLWKPQLQILSMVTETQISFRRNSTAMVMQQSPPCLEGELSTLGCSFTFNFKVEREVLMRGEDERQHCYLDLNLLYLQQ